MPPLNIDFSSRFKAEAQALSEERKQQVAEAVARFPELSLSNISRGVAMSINARKNNHRRSA
jgi:hypothetical protein